MAIFINGRFLTQPFTGVQRYALEIVKALDILLDQDIINRDKFSFVLITPRKVDPKITLNNIHLKQVGIFKGHFWEQFILPFFVGKALLINLCNTAPLIKKNNVVTIHDAGVFATPEAYTFLFRKWYRALFLCLRFRSRQFVTISRFSCDEFIKYCKIAENKIHVIYEGAEHILASPPDNTILRKYELVDKGYLLVVGSLSSNKNFNLVGQAMIQISDKNIPLVIVGGNNRKIFRQTGVAFLEKVKYVGYISDGELRSLYEHAAGFIFPSIYEGFGLPPLEAMACGCPVIASNSASIPEICGDGPLYVDPAKVEELIHNIDLLLEDKQLWLEISTRGKVWAKKYSWEKAATELMNRVNIISRM